MKTPERKSVTRLRAPKPMATPATPALASSGARLMPSTDSAVSAAVLMTPKEATLRSTEPIACERCLRRSAFSSRPLMSAPGWSRFPPWAIRATIRLITLRTIARITSATTEMNRICRVPVTQCCQWESR
jgi:hypothetical protein